ncbi:TetR/AcrR family transcriptional regulator [Allokutzneria sp. A3M-2-11 16]|uniref:TetR/AcrR family transcriptional regulator n=1 Tax=Allokutzneria sp. A3M-2-11 16 TaxID=2962043 RepID=UPI0020B6F28D|nr:TetR/AcrR family transcriptional regulator [Allokutzneria sp. A3M-2-11 16]MCP3797746.1 TetR/AcrR family transcriptional regulator [Allokutzneria sp. A3M-2-11 16]
MVVERDVAPRKRLGRQDWTAAALRALGEGGLRAVAIEPLAARLGATKGSAYHHFPNRDALVAAMLERWEDEHTDAVITAVRDEPDPLRRLRLLITKVITEDEDPSIELALLAAADDPLVAPVLRRVTERRVDYIAEIVAELGLSPAKARRRALVAYSTYVGHTQLARMSASMFPETRAAQRVYLDEMVDVLSSGLPG